MAAALALSPVMANAADSSVEARLKALEERQNQLEQQLVERDARIRELESQAKVPNAVAGVPPRPSRPRRLRRRLRQPLWPRKSQPWPMRPYLPPRPLTRSPTVPRSNRPGAPTKAARGSCWRDDPSKSTSALSLTSVTSTKVLEDRYTDAFDRTKELDIRNDLQLQKVMLNFKGWLFDPDFRYLFYTWTCQHQPGPGCAGGRGGKPELPLQRRFQPGRGIGGLPTTRPPTIRSRIGSGWITGRSRMNSSAGPIPPASGPGARSPIASGTGSCSGTT